MGVHNSRVSNTQELTSRLLIEEERIKSNETVTALSSKVESSKKKYTGSRTIKCFACNKMGHIAKKLSQNEGARAKERTEDMLLM